MIVRTATLAAALLLAVVSVTPAAAQSPAARPDYAQDATWLCRPGRTDACTALQDATIVAADGTLATERFVAARDPTFDCFYVYPTISRDRTPNSDMIAGNDERAVAVFQAARFTAHCRVFAPL